MSHQLQQSATTASHPVIRVSKPLLIAILPPVFAYLASTTFFWAIARSDDMNFFTVAARNRWDSVHYLTIAAHGYEFFRCGDRPGLAGWEETDWCGNAGWFPVYPLLIRLLHALGFPYQLAGILITEIALLAMFGVLWWLLGARLNVASVVCLAIAVVFPGSIYFHAIFPMALGTVGLLVSIIGLKRDAWLVAGIGGAIAIASHIVGVAIIGVLALSFLFAWNSRSAKTPPRVGEPPANRMIKAFSAAAVATLGLLFVFLVQHYQVGHWNAYLLTQDKYGNGLHNPFTVILEVIEKSSNAQRLEIITNIVIVGLALMATTLRGFRNRGLDTVDWVILLLTVTIFFIPLVAGPAVSWYRNHAEMFAAVLLLRDLPRVAQIAALALCGVSAAALSGGFFAGTLVLPQCEQRLCYWPGWVLGIFRKSSRR